MPQSDFTPDEPAPREARQPAPRRPDDYDRDDIPNRIRRRDADDPVSALIPYKNPKALLAYYLGVFSLIPCLGVVLGPSALLLGILGITYVNRHPTARGTGHAIAGIILGGLTTLGNWGGIALLIFQMATAK